MDTANSQLFSIKYADFWTDDGGGLVKGLLSVSEDAAEDGVISLDELTAWELDWTGNASVNAFSISSKDGSATALVEPGGFSLSGSNTPVALDFSDADGLDQGLYESGSGDQFVDLGAVIVEDVASGTFTEGDAAAGSISVSEVVDFAVDYSGFWGADSSVQGLIYISEADAADGVASLDELVGWSFDWSGNSDVAAFSVSSDEGSATALLPPGGFLLDGANTPIDANFNDADGLDQGLYEAASGDQYIDLGALIIEDLAAGTFVEGDAAAADASTSVSKVLDVDVEYSGFWGDEGSVTGGFSISEADAADGVASLDELISWSWDWTGNSDVAAFSVSSAAGSATALLPPGGFLLDGENTAIDSNFVDADGLDQGLYETESGDQYIDLGALIIEDLAAGTFTEGDAAATTGSIAVGDDSGNGGGGNGGGGNGGGTPDEDVLLYGNGNILNLVGGSGNDGLYGSHKDETFESGAGDDKIYSNGGADYIDSGSGMDEVWLGGASDAIVVLSKGEGYDFIANYQMGMTTLKGFAESELTLKNGADGAEIFKGDDKLAVVGWKTVSELAGAFVV